MFSDTFLAPLPRGQQLHEIETVANFIATKILSANKSYLTSNDVSEKIDILLCLITYQSTLSLLNAAYITEDDNTLELAKQTYRNVPNHLTHTTNFTADDLEAFVDMMTEALQASSSIEVILLSHLTDNKSFIGLAESIRGKTNVYKRA
jgi:hypothetical protein